MITEEEVRKAAHFRFGGVSDDHSAFRGVFIHGAMWAIVEIQSKNETLRTKMTKKEMLSDIAANDYSRLRNVHSDFLLLDSRANNARRQFNMGLIEFKQHEDALSQCRYAALDLVEKIWHGTITMTAEMTKIEDGLPPLGVVVECAESLPGLVQDAELYDITRGLGFPVIRFLVKSESDYKREFISPKYWRLKK